MTAPTFDLKSADRRVRRTRKALRDALLTLAARRSWDDISVQDICSAADVGRSTFYAHYDGKDALLANGLREFLTALYEETATPRAPFGYVEALLGHVREQRRVFRTIVGRRSGQVAQARFRETLGELVARDLAPRLTGDAERELVVRCVAGALFEVLALVAESGQAIDAAAVRRRLARLAE